MLKLDKLNLALVLARQASREFHRIFHRLDFVTGGEDEPRFIAPVTDNAFVNDVLGEFCIFSDDADIFHAIGNERFDELRKSLRHSR